VIFLSKEQGGGVFMSKSFFKITRFAFLLTALSVVRLAAVKIEGVEVGDGYPLTQKHLPVLLENFSGGVEGLEGSYLAWSRGRIMELERERNASFPGDPGEIMREHARTGKDVEPAKWQQLVRDKAKYQSYQTQIEKFEGIYKNMEKFRPAIVSFFMAVEEYPDAFVFPDKGSVPKEDNAFPFKRGTGTASFDFFNLQQIFNYHARTYRWEGMENVSIFAKERGVEFLQSLAKISPVKLEQGDLDTLVRRSCDLFLNDTWNQDDVRNAVFVIEEVGFPLVDAARQVQEEAKAAAKAKAEQVDGISAT
jgi:hypothetical protein